MQYMVVQQITEIFPLQLITDIAVSPNNIDDSVILYDRIDTIK
jgi:hypothetical protein